WRIIGASYTRRLALQVGRTGTIRQTDMRTTTTAAAILLLLSFNAAPSAQNRGGGVPTPDSVFGFAPGADYKLATYDQSVDYFKKVAASSKFVVRIEAGPTSQGRTMYFALVSSPDNLSKIDRYREIARRLAHPDGLSEAEA